MRKAQQVIPSGRAFQLQGTANAKALRQERASGENREGSKAQASSRPLRSHSGERTGLCAH